MPDASRLQSGFKIVQMLNTELSPKFTNEWVNNTHKREKHRTLSFAEGLLVKPEENYSNLKRQNFERLMS